MILAAELALIEALPALAFQGALVFCRLGAAVMLLPGLGEAEVPATLRLSFALLLVLTLAPVLAPGLPPLPGEVWPLAAMVAQEVIIGLWIGLLARIIALALAQAGQVIALMMGLVSPLQGDAVLGVSATAPARMLGLATAVLVLVSGLYEMPLRALVASYQVVPAGAALPAGAAAEAVARGAAGLALLAVQLAAPFVIAAIFFNAALGLVSRLAPQAQIFVIAAPLQILGGFLLMMAVLPVLLTRWWDAAVEGFARLPGGG